MNLIKIFSYIKGVLPQGRTPFAVRNAMGIRITDNASEYFIRPLDRHPVLGQHRCIAQGLLPNFVNVML